MYPNTFKSHDSRHISSFISVKLPGGIAPALFTKISILSQNFVNSSAEFLRDKSIEKTSTETLVRIFID